VEKLLLEIMEENKIFMGRKGGTSRMIGLLLGIILGDIAVDHDVIGLSVLQEVEIGFF
jgi:hypothetical protein